MNSADLIYTLWFTLAVSPAGKRRIALLKAFKSPKGIYAAGRETLNRIPGITSTELNALSNKNLDEAEKLIDDCKIKKINIIDSTDEEYPKRLLQLDDYPLALYVLGNLPSNDLPAITIVGTRDMTEYGEQVTRRLTMTLAQLGYVIVSGMALGVDSAAHSGALRVGGSTVAVLGCGVDVIYPRGNKDLYDFITRDGAVVSEYPPGTEPYRSNFPQLNIILSGLSMGTVVIEACSRSGSLITANCALNQSRDVYAVPGSIANPFSEGTNNLLKAGAKAVTCAMDIVEEYANQYPHTLLYNGLYTLLTDRNSAITVKPIENNKNKDESVVEGVPDVPVSPNIQKNNSENKTNQKTEIKPEEKIKEAVSGSLSTKQQSIYNALDGPTSLDDIIKRTGLTASEINIDLTLMEIDGIIEAMPGFFRRL